MTATAILIGPDGDDLGDALESVGVSVTRVPGTGSKEQLKDANASTADLLVVTDVTLATSIPIARELNDDLRVVVYSEETIPEFARATAELIVDPALLAPETVAETLTDEL
ncbi:DUF7126 family protein [Halocatena halophila]|uniref:DUF7126 family protein n=1 Tax=Halocatena halophila TaxID=2814576 RepID=UPI002ED1A972